MFCYIGGRGDAVAARLRIISDGKTCPHWWVSGICHSEMFSHPLRYMGLAAGSRFSSDQNNVFFLIKKTTITKLLDKVL